MSLLAKKTRAAVALTHKLSEVIMNTQSKNFDIIFWDIDNTILNFPYQENYALEKCFKIFKLKKLTPEMKSAYTKISEELWQQIHARTIDKSAALSLRFDRLFEKFGIEFSGKKFNEEFQKRLGDKVQFNDNANLVIKALHNKVRQYITTDGSTITQQREIEAAKLAPLVNGVFVSEAVGYSKASTKFFDYVFSQIDCPDRSRVLIVGDSLSSDMAGGKNAHIKCCWYNPEHKKNTDNTVVDFEIDDIRHVLDIVFNKN